MERSKVETGRADPTASGQALLVRAAADPVGLIGALLAGAGHAMRASEIKGWLVTIGVAPMVVRALWPAVRKSLRRSAAVAVAGVPRRYRWVGPARQPHRAEVVGHPHADRVAELERALAGAEAAVAAACVRADTAELSAKELVARCEHLEEILRQEHTQSVVLRSAQQRQLQIDVIRTLADLAAEVEELATDQFGTEVLVDRVRALVSAQSLEPIGGAGATLPFDPNFHVPAVGAPAPGTMATIIRPGYRWRFGDEDLVINKALVSVT